VWCADGHVLRKRKHQSKKHSSGASSSDEEPDYGKRSRHDDTASEEHRHRPSAHADQNSDRSGKNETGSGEAERYHNEEKVLNGDVRTDQKDKKHRDRRRDERASRETGRKHSAGVKCHRRDDRSRSRSVDVVQRHHKDSRDDAWRHKVEKQRDRRTDDDERLEHGSKKHISDEKGHVTVDSRQRRRRSSS